MINSTLSQLQLVCNDLDQLSEVASETIAFSRDKKMANKASQIGEQKYNN